MNRAPIHFFDKSMTVQRSTVTKDATGGVSNSWANHLTGVSARFQQASADEVVRYGRESTGKSWRIITAGGQDIQAKDRISATFNIGGVSTTLSLDVLGVSEGQSAGVTMVVIAEELK